MTRLPHENWQVDPFAGPRYKVAPECAVTYCRNYADHAHHLWRRSHLGKDAAWVILWNDRVVGNLVPLCFMHHQLITENLAWIEYDAETHLFHWATKDGDNFHRQEALSYQPPVGGEIATASRSRETTEDDLTADQEVCTACGSRRRRRQPASGDAGAQPAARRPRASWSISVPSDERERGADVLDELCEGVMEAFGREHHTSGIARYFAVVEAFTFVIQHRHLLVEEGV